MKTISRTLPQRVGGLIIIIASFAMLCGSLRGQSPSPSGTPAPQTDPFIKKSPANVSFKAEPKATPKPALNLFFAVEIYALTKTDAALLMDKSGSGTSRYDGVRELVKSGKAKLETLMANTTTSGQRSVVEQVDEVRYPSEFHPPLAAGDSAFPTAYDTRNAGDTLEYETVLSKDHRQCDLNIQFTSVNWKGFYSYPSGPQGSDVANPVFESRKFTTSQLLTVGSTEFLGSFSSSRPEESLGKEAVKPEKADIRWVFGRICVRDIQTMQNIPQSLLPLEDVLKKSSQIILEPQIQIYSMDREVAQRVLADYSKSSECYAAVEKLANENQAQCEPDLDDLLADHKKPGEFPAAVKKLAIEDYRRERDLFGACPMKSGQRGTVEITREVKFPTEYKPVVDGTNGASKSSTAPTSAQIPKGPHFYPSAFEVRNAGISLEIEPVFMPNGTINVNLVPQIVRHLGNLKVEGISEKYPTQPLFEARKITTSLSVTPGAQTLVGTLNPPGVNGVNDRQDTGRVWLCFLRVNLVKPQ